MFLCLQIVHENTLIFWNAFVTQSYLLTQETETTEMLVGAYPYFLKAKQNSHQLGTYHEAW